MFQLNQGDQGGGTLWYEPNSTCMYLPIYTTPLVKVQKINHFTKIYTTLDQGRRWLQAKWKSYIPMQEHY